LQSAECCSSIVCKSCENIKVAAKQSLGLHELKQHKAWFHEEYLQLFVQRKQDKMLILWDFFNLKLTIT
jgi:hypothetical protein